MFNIFKQNKQSVNVQEAFKNTKDNNKNILIDVREQNEFRSGHAKGSKNFPLSQIQNIDIKQFLNFENVYVICQSGGRSLRATEYLKSKNINAINVSGGTSSWIQNGLSIER